MVDYHCSLTIIYHLLSWYWWFTVAVTIQQLFSNHHWPQPSSHSPVLKLWHMCLHTGPRPHRENGGSHRPLDVSSTGHTSGVWVGSSVASDGLTTMIGWYWVGWLIMEDSRILPPGMRQQWLDGSLANFIRWTIALISSHRRDIIDIISISIFYSTTH